MPNEILKSFRQFFPATPLEYHEALSQKHGVEIYLKREDKTSVRSYKIRGALNFIRRFRETDDKAQRFVCASAGNHAQGFAYACRKYKLEGKVFMPVTTPAQKIRATMRHGGQQVEVVLVGDVFDDSARAAKEWAEEHQAVFVPPFDHPFVIEGQGSIATEINEQLGEVPAGVVFPVGGGGLGAGLMQTWQDNLPKCFAIEPERADSLGESLRQGKRVDLDTIDTFVDGASVKQIGENNWNIISKKLTAQDAHTVSVGALCVTMLEWLETYGVVLEPAGALALASLEQLDLTKLKGQKIVVIISGSNFDFDRLSEVRENADRHQGVRRYILLRLPQRPGALRSFLDTMEKQDIIRFEYLKKSSRQFGTVLIGIKSEKDDFPAFFERVEAAGFSYEDVTYNQALADFVL